VWTRGLEQVEMWGRPRSNIRAYMHTKYRLVTLPPRAISTSPNTHGHISRFRACSRDIQAQLQPAAHRQYASTTSHWAADPATCATSTTDTP